MEIPYEDHDIQLVANAIEAVQKCTQKKYGTYYELDKEIRSSLLPFKQFGDGFERLRDSLTSNLAQMGDPNRMVEKLQERCHNGLAELKQNAQNQINDVLPFIKSASRIVVHGCSSLLALCISCATRELMGVEFLILEGFPGSSTHPNGTGRGLLEKCLQLAEGVWHSEAISLACQIIPDSAIGAVMESADFVMLGSYAVTEHGGLIHTIGSLPLCIVAGAMSVPCYVLCETFKFSGIFPLSTKDLFPQSMVPLKEVRKAILPNAEFVPPSMISLIFSEKGIMPPSAVADEMLAWRFHVTRKKQI